MNGATTYRSHYRLRINSSFAIVGNQSPIQDSYLLKLILFF